VGVGNTQEKFGFRTFFHVVRRQESIASYLPTGLLAGSSRSWPSLFLPSSFSLVSYTYIYKYIILRKNLHNMDGKNEYEDEDEK
jgi:hypothetical protein